MMRVLTTSGCPSKSASMALPRPHLPQKTARRMMSALPLWMSLRARCHENAREDEERQESQLRQASHEGYQLCAGRQGGVPGVPHQRHGGDP